MTIIFGYDNNYTCYIWLIWYFTKQSDDLGQIYEDTLRPFFPHSEQVKVDQIVRVCLPQPDKTCNYIRFFILFMQYIIVLHLHLNEYFILFLDNEEYNCDTIADFVKCCYNVYPKSVSHGLWKTFNILIISLYTIDV